MIKVLVKPIALYSLYKGIKGVEKEQCQFAYDRAEQAR